jgi:hypothetical protein
MHTIDAGTFTAPSSLVMSGGTLASAPRRLVNLSGTLTAKWWDYRVLDTPRAQGLTLQVDAQVGDVYKDLNDAGQSFTDKQIVITSRRGGLSPITWVSSNPAIATIDNDGKITCIDDGFVTFTGTSEERIASFIAFMDKNIATSSEVWKGTYVAGSWKKFAADYINSFIAGKDYSHLPMYTVLGPNPARNPSWWGAGHLNMAAIPSNANNSMNSFWGGCLIGPRIMLLESHWSPDRDAGDVECFTTMDGQYVRRTYAKSYSAGIPGVDTRIMEFDTDIDPAIIKPVKFLPSNWKSYLPNTQHYNGAYTGPNRAWGNGMPCLQPNQDGHCALLVHSFLEQAYDTVVPPDMTLRTYYWSRREISNPTVCGPDAWAALYEGVRGGDSGNFTYTFDKNHDLVVVCSVNGIPTSGPYRNYIQAAIDAHSTTGWQLQDADLTGFTTFP